jgi:hypothetical protein
MSASRPGVDYVAAMDAGDADLQRHRPDHPFSVHAHILCDPRITHARLELRHGQRKEAHHEPPLRSPRGAQCGLFVH